MHHRHKKSYALLPSLLLVFGSACTLTAEQDVCQEEADCAASELCRDGRCVEPCDTTEDCQYRSDTCQQGVCRPAVDAGSVQDAAIADASAVLDNAVAIHDSHMGDHSQPDGTRPDTSRPDTTRPDTTRPDTTRPDTTRPDALPVDDFCQGGDVILREHLNGSAGGTVSGGSFNSEGWRTSSTTDQIYWNLGEVVSSGSIEFEAKGFHADVGGCLAGVCYYVGLFEEANGDKRHDYTGSAFIESRFHTNRQENFHDTFKIQAGDGSGAMQEPMIPPGVGFGANQWHRYRIEWGGGHSHLYLDGTHRLQANYNDGRSIQWRHLFLGTTNYKGAGWAATGVTYRDLCVRR